MSAKLKSKASAVKGKVIHIGVDIHLKSWRVTGLVEGSIVLAVTIAKPNYHSFKKVISRFAGNQIRVAYEAGFSGFDLFDRLSADGIECIVTPPSLIPTESGSRVKTDKKDSLKLAKLLESGMLKKVYVLSPEQRGHRQLVRTRRQVVRHRCDVMRQIKSFLMFHSIDIPFPSNRQWTGPFLKWLKELQFKEPCLTVSLQPLVQLYCYLDEVQKKMTSEVRQLAKNEIYAQNIKLLKSIPGVGDISAMEFMVEIQNVERFSTSDELAGYLGLTPSQYSSGEKIRMGRITHEGNSRVRSALVECSWILISKDPVMRQKYERIKIRRGAKRAIVAVARNLSARIRRVLLDQTPYQSGFQKAA